jgi:hypothetical protein
LKKYDEKFQNSSESKKERFILEEDFAESVSGNLNSQCRVHIENTSARGN